MFCFLKLLVYFHKWQFWFGSVCVMLSPAFSLLKQKYLIHATASIWYTNAISRVELNTVYQVCARFAVKGNDQNFSGTNWTSWSTLVIIWDKTKKNKKQNPLLTFHFWSHLFCFLLLDSCHHIPRFTSVFCPFMSWLFPNLNINWINIEHLRPPWLST